jgi:hypothetical protein
VDVAASASGAFFIAEQGGNRIRRVDASGQIARIAGTGGPRYGGDGMGAAAGLVNAPQAVELMPSGTELLVADTDNNRLRYIAIPGHAARLAFAPLTASLTAPLKRVTVKVKNRKSRTLVVSDRAIPLRASKASDVEVVISTKKGKRVAQFARHIGSGAVSLHLPGALRSGKLRLKKDHYVLSMTAIAAAESARHDMELIVK